MTRRRRPVSSALLTLSLGCLPVACGGEAPSQPANHPTPAAPGGAAGGGGIGAQEALEKFQSLCSTCHGTTGHGDGPGAAAINPKPRSFADVAWQESVTDEQIQKTIVFGGAAVGKSPFMPASPDLKGKTEVLQALTKIVRGYRGK